MPTIELLAEIAQLKALNKQLVEALGNVDALLRDRRPHSEACTYIRPGVCSCGLFSLQEEVARALAAAKEMGE